MHIITYLLYETKTIYIIIICGPGGDNIIILFSVSLLITRLWTNNNKEESGARITKSKKSIGTIKPNN